MLRRTSDSPHHFLKRLDTIAAEMRSRSRDQSGVLPSPNDSQYTPGRDSSDSPSTPSSLADSPLSRPRRNWPRQKQHQQHDTEGCTDTIRNSSCFLRRPFTVPNDRARSVPLLWQTVADAETGEPLELRQPAWNFDLLARRPDTCIVVPRNRCGNERWRSREGATLANDGTCRSETRVSGTCFFGGDEQCMSGAEKFDEPMLRGSNTGGNRLESSLPRNQRNANNRCTDDNDNYRRMWSREIRMRPQLLELENTSPPRTAYLPSPSPVGNQQTSCVEDHRLGDIERFDSFCCCQKEEPEAPRSTEHLRSPCWLPIRQEPSGQTFRPRSSRRQRPRGTNSDAGSTGFRSGIRYVMPTNQSRLSPASSNQERYDKVSADHQQCCNIKASSTTSTPKQPVQLLCKSKVRHDMESVDPGANDGVFKESNWSSKMGDSNRFSSVALTSGSSYTTIPDSVPDDVWQKMIRVQETRDRYLRYNINPLYS